MSKQLACALIASLFATTPALAQQRPIAATFMEPTHQIARIQFDEWANQVREDTAGEVDFEVFTAGALVPANGMMDAVSSGLAQIGMFVSGYYPSALPIANFIADMGFVEPDPQVLQFAWLDFVTHEEIGQRDYANAGAVFVAATATDSYYILCRDDVQNLDDLRGKRVRTAGSGWARLAEELGLVPVNIPWPEVYPALERRAVDCLIHDPSALNTGPRILPMIKSVYMLPMAPYYTSAAHAANAEFWAGLTEEQRQVIFTASARAMIDQLVETQAQVAAALDEARAADIRIVEPEQQARAVYDGWIQNGLGGLDQIARNSYGIENPEELIALFQTYIDKWKNLLDGVPRDDADAIFAIVQQNLIDQVDFAAYGVAR